MRTSNFSQSAVGWMAIATGVSVILAVIFIILMATLDVSFGTLNDVFNGILGILSGILAWMLYPHHHARSALLSRIALLLAVVGAVFTILGSVLIIFDFTGFVLAGWYTAVGNALIGLWLASFCFAMQHSDTLPRNLVMFGLVVGAFMGIGMLGIPGILTGVDSMASLPWYLVAVFFGFLGTYILYPIWTIWLGRRITGK